MAKPKQQARRTRRAKRIACQDGYHRTQFVGLWPVPSPGVVVLLPAGESVRFSLRQAISLRAALYEAITELPAPTA